MKANLRSHKVHFTTSLKAFLLSVILSGLTSTTAMAVFLVPGYRGNANTEYGGWDDFTDGFTDPADIGVGGEGNLPDLPGSTSDAVLYQIATGAGGTIASSGNLYGPDGPLSLELHETPGFKPAVVLLQTFTDGAEVELSSFNLSIGGQDFAPTSIVELDRELRFITTPGGTFPSPLVQTAFEWDLSGLGPIGSNDFVISFDSSGASMSLLELAIDTSDTFVTSVPEPSALLFLSGLAAATFTLKRRRR